MAKNTKSFYQFSQEARKKNGIRKRKSKQGGERNASNNPPQGQLQVQGKEGTRIGGSTTHLLPEPRAGQVETTAEISHQPPTY